MDCQFTRGWDDIPGLVRLLRTYKRTGAMDSVRKLFLEIPYSRDIVRGKGERDLSYRMIYAFYQVFPILAIKAVHLLFMPRMKEGLPSVGSWCDIKRLCIFIEKVDSANHPLIEVVASIANRYLRKDDMVSHSSIAKWIPRESRHPDLFSMFVRNWYRKRMSSTFDKKIYRKMISEKCLLGVSGGVGGTFRFMGDYVRRAIRGGSDVSRLDSQWNKMLKTFPWGSNGIALIDIDISIPDERLFHAIGYGIFVALKMGSKRILLMGVEPIWVDLSLCNGFVEMVQFVWSFCEIRGISRYEGVWSLLAAGMKYVFDASINVFVFSDQFRFDWTSLFRSIGEKGVGVLWNLGSGFEIPCDLYLENFGEFLYMSGYSPGLMMRFFSQEVDGYCDWNEYFDLFETRIKIGV